MYRNPFNTIIFKEIYDLHYESLYKFLQFYSRDAHLIEDVIQEVFLTLWEKREKLDIAHPKTYIFTTARNCMLNHIRDDKNRSALLEKWFNEQLRQTAPDKDKFEIENLLALVDKAIDTLPEKCRKIFNMSKAGQLSYKQIARQENISIKTVETQMGIALRKIRDFMAETGADLF